MRGRKAIKLIQASNAYNRSAIPCRDGKHGKHVPVCKGQTAAFFLHTHRLHLSLYVPFLFSQYMSPYLSLPLSPPIYIQEHIRRHVDTCINIHIQCTNMHTHPDKPKHERTGTWKSTFGPALCVFSNDARRSEFQPR